MTAFPEPPRQDSITLLKPHVRDKVELLMSLQKREGYDPILYETGRTALRQTWLYGYGRWHHKSRPKITKSMDSKHLDGEAADIISESRKWSYPEFYSALARNAKKVGLTTLIEGCHVQYGD